MESMPSGLTWAWLCCDVPCGVAVITDLKGRDVPDQHAAHVLVAVYDADQRLLAADELDTEQLHTWCRHVEQLRAAGAANISLFSSRAAC
jgi:hypothetical protein